MEKIHVCPCGLTCCDCMFYKKDIYETAYKLRELIKENRLDIFLNLISNKSSWLALGEHLDLKQDELWEGIGKHLDIFSQMPVFLAVLNGIISLQCKATCIEAGGCSVGGSRHRCKALKCIESKGYEGCWQCGEFGECDNLKFLEASYGHVITDNLKTIKDKGIDAVQSRGDKYYEWQRRIRW